MAGAQSLSEFHSKASSNHCSHGPTTSRFSPVTSPAERAISNDTSELKLQSVTSSCSPISSASEMVRSPHHHVVLCRL